MTEENCKQVGTGLTPRELTFGEKAVGLKFNPAGDDEVDKIKRLYAEIIDLCDRRSINSKFEDELRTESIMKAITAQMAAVKLITWRY